MIFTHEIIQAVIITWLVASVIKYIIALYNDNCTSFFEEFFVTGGMPSSHSAIVTCVTVSIFLLEGVSNLFVVSGIFSLLVIRDSFGVRKSVGDQAKLINKIAKKDHIHASVKVVLGHTLYQVITGMLLGALVAVLVIL